jgi:hypothetical protein
MPPPERANFGTMLVPTMARTECIFRQCLQDADIRRRRPRR